MNNPVFAMIQSVVPTAVAVAALVELVEHFVAEQLNCCCGSFYCY